MNGYSDTRTIWSPPDLFHLSHKMKTASVAWIHLESRLKTSGQQARRFSSSPIRISRPLRNRGPPLKYKACQLLGCLRTIRNCPSDCHSGMRVLWSLQLPLVSLEHVNCPWRRVFVYSGGFFFSFPGYWDNPRFRGVTRIKLGGLNFFASLGSEKFVDFPFNNI